MKYTEKLGLKKPESTDYVNIEDINENMDILDEQVGELKEGSTIITDLETENKTLAGAINEVKTDLDEHKADLASQEVGKGADIIGLPDPNNLFTATNIGGAMQELFTNVSNGKTLVGGAITDIDNSVVIPTDPTFQQLADAVGQISTGKKWASGFVGTMIPYETRTISLTESFVPSIVIITSQYSSTWLPSITLYSSQDSRWFTQAGRSGNRIHPYANPNSGGVDFGTSFDVRNTESSTTFNNVRWIAIE